MVPDARGLVPVRFFQALGKTAKGDRSSDPKNSGLDHDSGFSEGGSSGTRPSIGSPQQQAGGADRMSKMGTGKGSGAMVYGIVMYDFAAERPDELEAKAGEAIIVIAQSNPEWFVAKPIGRLGGPGLIPVSFIEIRDMVTGKPVEDATEAVQRAGVPKVEEWKRMAAEYKNSSIELGRLAGEEGSESRQSLQAQARQSQQQQIGQGGQPIYVSLYPKFNTHTDGAFSNKQQQQQMRQSQQVLAAQKQQQYQPQQAQQQQYAQQPQQQAHPSSSLFAPITASIPRYVYADEKYWFIISCQYENGSVWELQRYYEDFYDFQIALLTEFPTEAGNAVDGSGAGKSKRTLPYMPGPVSYVTDQITEGRRANLDAYVQNLLGLQPEYISRCGLVKEFFCPREGDYEVDPNEPEQGADERYSESQPSEDARDENQQGYGGLSAAPPRQQQPMGYPAAQRQPSAGGLNPPPLTSMNSSMSAATTGTTGTVSGTLKVKIYFGEDLFAIRVPRDIDWRKLYEKIRERLKIPGGEEIVMAWKDDQRGGEKRSLEGDEDLDEALGQSDKLVVFVEYGDYDQQ